MDGQINGCWINIDQKVYLIGEFKNNFVGYKVGIILIKIVGIEYRSLER